MDLERQVVESPTCLSLETPTADFLSTSPLPAAERMARSALIHLLLDISQRSHCAYAVRYFQCLTTSALEYFTMVSFPSLLQSTKCSPITIALAKQCYIDRYVLVTFQIWPIILRWMPVMDNPVCFYCLVHLFNQYQQSPCSPSFTSHDILNHKDQL